MSPLKGQLVCSHIIESENKLVIIDTLLLRPYAERLRKYADSLNKPIERVIITHFHPDHWLG
ncbi:MBL fold metallo-hydrolase, partial [Candidatus Desantisbacteria bacterium]|nr:MBL fold metallo-hydrolase [Candidatus Desantisbacteria bacterium]